jgi:hypothetical protein
MSKSHYSARKLKCSIFLIFFAWFNFNNSALANDEEAIKKAFLSLNHFAIEDEDFTMAHLSRGEW